VFVAERGGEVVGFVSVGRSEDPDAQDDTGELYAIYVRRSQWGRGAGGALMDAALTALREHGFREATLWVLEDNPRTRRFYELVGWHADGAMQSDSFLGIDGHCVSVPN
jgi:ribosomal protein S18 acetylase RimI-like enzyme